MNKFSFVSSKKLCALDTVVVGAWLMTSCADTYDGNDTFDSDVRNTQLASPAEGDITITPNTDGDQIPRWSTRRLTAARSPPAVRKT